MEGPRAAAPAPHRLNYPVVLLALFAVLGIGAAVAAIIASGTHEQTPSPTRLSAAARRQLTAAAFGGTIQNSTVAVSPPSSWSIQEKTSTRIALEPSDRAGINSYVSGRFGGTLLQLAQGEIANTQKETTNGSICLKPAKQKVPNGPAGIIFGICATIVPQNGQATRVFQMLVLGVSRGVGTEIDFVTSPKPAVLKRFLSESRPVYSTVHWKLLH